MNSIKEQTEKTKIKSILKILDKEKSMNSIKLINN
jgi:hypothetical protein